MSEVIKKQANSESKEPSSVGLINLAGGTIENLVANQTSHIGQEFNLRDNLYSCQSISQCEACTEAEVNTKPYCQSLSQIKQLFKCSTRPLELGQPISPDYRVEVFRECPEAISLEKYRFFKLQTFVLILGLISFVFLQLRKRKLRAEQYKRLMSQVDSS